MERTQAFKLGAVVVILGAAIAIWLATRTTPVGQRIYFYDLSEKKLFTAPRDAFAPIDGVGGEAGDGVEAVVVCCPECGRDHMRIAYLQSHTSEFKSKDEEARRAGQAIPDLTRQWVWANTLVKLVDASDWHPSTSKEGAQIVAGLKRKCQTHGTWEKPIYP
jgi:hypothetical protein